MSEPMTILRLAHYGAEPIAELDHHREYPPPRLGKPSGFWVSVEGDGEGWADWCRSEGFDVERLAHKHDVTLVDDARILWLTTPSDLDDFTIRYGMPSVVPGIDGIEGIDWAGVAADWQGIVIAPYQWSRRLQLFWYYGWDCASGCIWDLMAIASIRPSPETGV